MSTLLLDPDIRDWVVLPLFAIMVLAGIIRHYVGILLANEKKRVPDLWQRSQNLMKQTSKIRSPGAHYMTTWKWHVRKNHYAERLEAGAVYAEEEEEARKTKKAEDGSGDDKELDPMEMMMGGANPLSMILTAARQHENQQIELESKACRDKRLGAPRTVTSYSKLAAVTRTMAGPFPLFF